MRETLLIRGIFQTVLNEILNAISNNPNLTLFLQPYSGFAIRILRDDPPSCISSVRLFLSTSDDVNTVSYTADIVGWEDKTQLTCSRRKELLAILHKFQPDEGGLYNHSKDPNNPSLNLVHIQNLTKLDHPFGVENLIKVSDNKPYSRNQQSPGGWSHVRLAKTIEEKLGQIASVP